MTKVTMTMTNPGPQPAPPIAELLDAPHPDGNRTKSGTCETPALQGGEAQTNAYGATWETITLSLPADTAMPVPAARWQRRDGRIVATYTPEELNLSVRLPLQHMLAGLEARLEWELEVLAAATGCDDAEAEQLLARWEALNADYTATVTALAPAIGDN